MRERREQFKLKRTAGYKRCGRVSSNYVSQEWVQDRSKVMVIIGSEAVSLYPSLTREESASEVPEAVLESNIKWDEVNWKEVVRFLVLGRDEAVCRCSGFGIVLPGRKHKTGVGPMGAAEDDENQWEFKKDLPR